MSEKLTTDYLVVGAGAVGMAFVDTLLDESDADVIIVDNHHQPGGHWNDAYSFVRLHQPSHFYGVASTPLGSQQIDTTGHNRGYFELATGNEVQAYFEKVMRERFIPSGRVRYFPMSEWLSSESGVSTFKNLLSGDSVDVAVNKKLVDTTFFKTTVPSRHTRNFSVADNVACVTPNELPLAADKHKQYCILGAGKTALDVGVWLLSSGAEPENISWVCPRRSWFFNREVVQGHKKFFKESISCLSDQMQAIADASDVDDLFDRMEACGFLLRIHEDKRPTMFHYAILSKGEKAQLRRITNLIEKGRVEAIGTTHMRMADGSDVAMSAETLYIDCTASATDFVAARVKPIFEPGLITPQAIQVPNACLSGAMAAYVEANYPDDETRNRLCPPIPIPDDPTGWMNAQLGNMMNQGIMNSDPKLKNWVSSCRLDVFGRVIREVNKFSWSNMSLILELRKKFKPAVINLNKLIADVEDKQASA